MARPACEFLISIHKSLHAQVNVWMVMSVDDADGMCRASTYVSPTSLTLSGRPLSTSVSLMNHQARLTPLGGSGEFITYLRWVVVVVGGRVQYNVMRKGGRWLAGSEQPHHT